MPMLLLWSGIAERVGTKSLRFGMGYDDAPISHMTNNRQSRCVLIKEQLGHSDLWPEKMENRLPTDSTNRGATRQRPKPSVEFDLMP